MRTTILFLVTLATTALAAPGPIGARQNAVTCGNNVRPPSSSLLTRHILSPSTVLIEHTYA